MEKLIDYVQYLESFNNQLRGFACSLRATITYFVWPLKTYKTMTNNRTEKANRQQMHYIINNNKEKKIDSSQHSFTHRFGSFFVESVVGNGIDINDGWTKNVTDK